MSRKIDITGQRFGRWVALYEVEPHIRPDGQKTRIWHCICDCGNEKDVMMSSLRRGSSQSCGCYNKDRVAEACSKDLTGMKFGRLTVIERDKESYKWKCICDCQKELENPQYTYSIGWYLEHGKTKSCGCYNKEVTAIRMKEILSKKNEVKFHDDYVEIIDTNKNSILVDLEDYESISKHYWYADKKGYAVTTINGKVVKLHRFIMDVNDKKIQVDHINHKKLDNRRYNLRIVNNSKNQMNRELMSNNNSGCAGVCWHTRDNIWEAHITVNYKQIYLGRFTDFDDAVQARKEAEKIYFGEYSYDESMKKAKQLGIPIISEEDFIKMIGE